jgi:hypothetical protein
VVQKTPEQPASQEFIFSQILWYERSTFERSCPTLSDLKPNILIEKIHEFYTVKSCEVSDVRVFCTNEHRRSNDKCLSKSVKSSKKI